LRISSVLSSSPASDGVSGQRHNLAALSPGKTHDTNCTEVWMGHSAGVDRCPKSLPLPVFDPRTVQPVACSPQRVTRKREFGSGIAFLNISIIMFITPAHLLEMQTLVIP
jgi:hypothetical protein